MSCKKVPVILIYRNVVHTSIYFSIFENPGFSISLNIFCSHELSSKRLGHKDFWYFKTKHGDFSSLSFSNNNSFGKPIHLNTSHSKNLSERVKRIFDLRGWPRIIANPVIKLGCLEFWHLLIFGVTDRNPIRLGSEIRSLKENELHSLYPKGIYYY